MNDPTRTKLIQALEELGRCFPTWRFGQLVENVAGWADVNTWDVEDEQLLAAVRQYLDQASEPATDPESSPAR